MAGIFGNDINNRAEFFQQLDRAIAECARLIQRLPDEDTLQSVALQLAAVRRFTQGGRTPRQSERESLDMALRMFREYEMTDDVEIHRFRGMISGIHNYVDYWPSDDVASDPNNDDYL